MISFIKIFILWLAFLISHAAFAANDQSLSHVLTSGKLSVCSDAGFLPFEMRSNTGVWSGYDIDMIQAFAKSIGVTLNMVQISFDGIIPALLSKKCNLIVSGMTNTPERSRVVLFSSPTFINKLSLVVKTSFLPEKKNLTLDDMDKPKVLIAVKTGYTSDIYLSKKLKYAQVLRFDQDADLVLALKQDRVQGFMIDSTYAQIIKNNGLNFIKEIDIPSEKQIFAVAGRKNDVALINAFNHFLENWKNKPEHEEIFKKYFHPPKPEV